MGDYHLFPQARGSVDHKYSVPSRKLSQQHQDSCESILMVNVPSPELCDSEEINQIWSRLSQSGSSSSSSSNLISVPASTRQPSDYRYQTLLPPALEYKTSHIPADGVTCRLSSASTEALSDSSPVLTKRSVTPDLLMQLSYNLGELSHQPETKDRAATVYSTSARSSTSSQSTIAVEMEHNHHRKLSQQHSFVEHQCMRQYPNAPPASPASPARYHRSAEQVTDSVTGAINRLQTSTSVPEVSRFDWDDDEDQHGRLARMKKSIGDLRAAALRTKPDLPMITPKRSQQQQVPSSPRSPRSKGHRSDVPAELPPRPMAARSKTFPTPIFDHPDYPPVFPPPQGPLPPRPASRPSASAERVQQSLPPLPHNLPGRHYRHSPHTPPKTPASPIPTSPNTIPKSPRSPSGSSSPHHPSTPSSDTSTLVSPPPRRQRSTKTNNATNISLPCHTTSTPLPTAHILHHYPHQRRPSYAPPIHHVRSVRRSRRVSTASIFSCISYSSATTASMGAKQGPHSKGSKKGGSSSKGMVGLRQLMKWAIAIAGLGRKGRRGGAGSGRRGRAGSVGSVRMGGAQGCANGGAVRI